MYSFNNMRQEWVFVRFHRTPVLLQNALLCKGLQRGARGIIHAGKHFFFLWKSIFLQVMTHDRSLPCLLIPWHWCSWQQTSPAMETELSQPLLFHCAGAPVYNLSNGNSKKSRPFSPMFMGFVAHSVCPYYCPKTLAWRADTWHHSNETTCPLSCSLMNSLCSLCGCCVLWLYLHG